ncbi:hypothetical protein NADFUDRAFT_53240 [Nadsonia fulvescens var. elongata DSM 6958]|uniref:Uncharacterized protein n=1 Tax=Nadsonia fulvescens var. elongata DSM 6958 TaxID=857566 RepID=A0A1E3PFB3_9ASCO|nr:hypothetical protein NADFUDRAFT_53240 [Nadsonia fulvescens var. elongata DSM 6958]
MNVNISRAHTGPNEIPWNDHRYHENTTQYRESPQLFQVPSHNTPQARIKTPDGDKPFGPDMTQYGRFGSYLGNSGHSVLPNSRSGSPIPVPQGSPTRRGSLSEGHRGSSSGIDLQMMLSLAAKRAELALLTEDLQSFGL